MVDDKIRKDKIRFSSYLVDAHRAHELLARQRLEGRPKKLARARIRAARWRRPSEGGLVANEGEGGREEDAGTRKERFQSGGVSVPRPRASLLKPNVASKNSPEEKN